MQGPLLIESDGDKMLISSDSGAAAAGSLPRDTYGAFSNANSGSEPMLISAKVIKANSINISLTRKFAPHRY